MKEMSVNVEGIWGRMQEQTILNHGNDEAGHSAIYWALGTVPIFCQNSEPELTICRKSRE